MKELVLDLSHWDGDMDLVAWKNKHKLWGVIIKAGGHERKLGRYKDPKFETYYKMAKQAGLHIGFYYYTVVTTINDANADAKHMLSLIEDKTYDLPWYMDVEDPDQYKLSKNDLTNVISAFCDVLVNAGHYAGIYTYGDAWLNNMDRTKLQDYANWIAWWKATWPTEAGEIGMWQQGGIRYSDGHIVYGDISGYHDCNWCIIDYPSRIKAGHTKQSEDLKNSEKASTVSQKSGRASDVIDAAYGELGYCASNDPNPGSKYGRWMADIFNESWLAGPSKEIWWCCMFVSWCLDKGGVKMDGFPTYNTDVALKNGAKRYAVDKKSVKYGDIIIFNWDWNNTTDHIGFATGEFDGVGFPTIEGNVGNAVQEKYRQMGNVAYVLRPPYDTFGVVSPNYPSVKDDPKNNRDGDKLEIDGIGGWNTVIDIQHQLGTKEDGWISGQNPQDRVYHWGMSNVTYDGDGSLVVKAIQKKVGCNPDGYWGPQTTKAIQTWLIAAGYSCGSAGVDGYFGTDSVMALQRSLNDGKWK